MKYLEVEEPSREWMCQDAKMPRCQDAKYPLVRKQTRRLSDRILHPSPSSSSSSFHSTLPQFWSLLLIQVIYRLPRLVPVLSLHCSVTRS